MSLVEVISAAFNIRAVSSVTLLVTFPLHIVIITWELVTHFVPHVHINVQNLLPPKNINPMMIWATWRYKVFTLNPSRRHWHKFLCRIATYKFHTMPPAVWNPSSMYICALSSFHLYLHVGIFLVFEKAIYNCSNFSGLHFMWVMTIMMMIIVFMVLRE